MPESPHDIPESYEQRLANLITQLADEFKSGARPGLEETCLAHSEFADDLRELWGTMILTQAAGDQQSTLTLSNSERPTPLALPFDLGDYRLEEEIGRGGMGIVYRALRHSDQNIVAIKMILKGDFAMDVDRQRFFGEAEAAARLDHPNIVPIHETGEFQGRAFFAMSLIEGETLANRLARGPIPPRDAAKLMRDLSLAIEFAHEHQVLHRDLKPSNILIDKSGRPFVADFGLAKFDHNRVSLTKSGAILGTPSYMSPEQAAGARGEVRASSDVYSLGAILYHMLTGRPPFLAATPVDTVLMVLEQDPIAPRALNRNIDRNIEMIVLRCLQKPQDLRYDNAQSLADDLTAYLNHESIAAREGRFGQVIANTFRETHHAVVLENWGLLWMWHSLVLLVACCITNVIYLSAEGNVPPSYLTGFWFVGFGTWAIVFWAMRRRMGPVTFVERQIAHLWMGSLICVALLYPLEFMLGAQPFELSPVIALIAGMVFLVKAGILSGRFYVYSALLFATAFPMAIWIDYSMFIFGFVCAICFFFPGLKYYRRRKNTTQSE